MANPPKTVWSVESIQRLTNDEIRNLRANALAHAEHAVVAICDAVARQRPKKRSWKSQATPAKGASTILSREAAEGIIARKITELPAVASVPNAVNRTGLQATPLRTLQSLWRLFLVCGFSSQEVSDEDSPLSRFAESNSPLLSLSSVREKRCDQEWVQNELRRHLPRQLRNKVALVVGAYPSFVQPGEPSDLLVDLCKASGGLKQFCDLARGAISDHDINASAAFSAAIDHSPFPYIGHKQIRNILVNSGLAHNVVPLDSRWQNFLGEVVPTTKATFSSSRRYLELEDILRSALIRAQDNGSDIINLSVLDAVVFAHMSKKASNPQAWFGSVAH